MQREKSIRIRCNNYSQSEKVLLMNLIQDHKGVIEDKATDGATLDKKRKTWERIQLLYNSSSVISGARSVDQLKNFYKSIKAAIRKKNAEGGNMSDPELQQESRESQPNERRILKRNIIKKLDYRKMYLKKKYQTACIEYETAIVNLAIKRKQLAALEN